MCLRPIVIVDLLGLDKLTKGFGLLLLFIGLAGCVGPPVAGLLYDQTGSFTIAYKLSAIAYFIGGCVCTGLPKFALFWAKRKSVAVAEVL